jgi:hypothetical protein
LGEPVEDLEEFEMGDPKKRIRVDSQLPQRVKEDLVAFLRCNSDVFAWNYEDMLGIDPSVIVHKLNVDSNRRPVKQRRRTFTAERNQAIAEEVGKLLKARFIREVD